MLARLQSSCSGEMETRTWLSQDSGLSVGCNLTDTYIYPDHVEYLQKDIQETIAIAGRSLELEDRGQETYFSFIGF